MFMGKYGIGVILIFMILVIGVMKPRFLYPSNILNVLTQISVNCLIAYGMCLCITTGGIDLSVGPQLALVSVLLGQFIVVRGMNIGLSVVLAVLAATVFGFVNGFLVAKFDMAAFVVTLATQLVIRSIAQIISDGQGMSKGIAFGPLYRHHPGGGFDRAGNPRYIRPAIPPELYLLVSDSHFRQGAHLRPNSDDALERIVGCTNR